jgi:hypothetical protein
MEDVLRWENNNIMDYKGIGEGCGLDSSGSEQHPEAGSCEHGNVSSRSMKCGGIS